MPQIINTNLFSLNAQRNLNETQNALSTSLKRLSSGLRINSAKDDAAGLAIAERFSAQIKGLKQAIRNANDGISFAQTAEGGLSTSTTALQRIRELAVQSANDTNAASDRQAINNEVQQLIAEVRRIANSTQFNGQNVLDGSTSSLVFQVGANQNQTISVSSVDARADVLGARVSTSGSISQASINAAIAANDLVINGKKVDLAGLSAGASVQDIIGKINAQTAQTGVSAQTATSVTTGELTLNQGDPSASPPEPAGGKATINGVEVTLTGTRADDIAAINALTAQTGVTAAAGDTANTVVLSNAIGNNIVTSGAGFSAGNGTYQAGVVLAGKVGKAFTVTGTFGVVTGSTALGGTQANQSVADTDVLTRGDATKALLTLDFALGQVNTLRSELGAVQTRFSSTVSNLQITSENLTAARSRIQDADFAAETAALTRSQILQQAGLSIVAQANSLPQGVLSLLK